MICVPYVLQSQNSMVAFALAYGGSEKSMEPGWEFMRKLAKTGNIGRVAKTEVDYINSLSSGECSVGIWSNAAWARISEAGPCVFLNRVPGDNVFRTGLLTEGFMIPSNSTKKKEAKWLLNFFVSAENSELYNKHLNFVPPNRKAGVTKLAENIVFKTSEERKEFAIVFDFVAAWGQRNEMNKWEKESPLSYAEWRASVAGLWCGFDVSLPFPVYYGCYNARGLSGRVRLGFQRTMGPRAVHPAEIRDLGPARRVVRLRDVVRQTRI
jgi:spermidine/putrescine-binding protein